MRESNGGNTRIENIASQLPFQWYLNILCLHHSPPGGVSEGRCSPFLQTSCLALDIVSENSSGISVFDFGTGFASFTAPGLEGKAASRRKRTCLIHDKSPKACTGCIERRRN